MSRGSLPGAEQAVLGRLVVRTDALETTLVQVRADVDRLTRATSSLTETLRRLPTQPSGPSSSGANAQTRRSAAGGGAAGEGEEGEGQRDWLAVTDPEVAVEWLIEVTGWWDAVGAVLVDPGQPCWPWHPKAVIAALALMAQYDDAYAADKPVGVSDLLTRWVPTLGHLVCPRDGDCNRHEHYTGGRPWSVARDLLPEYAHWWATDRTGIPPGLTPRG